MITPIVSLIFYIVDPVLGVILALVLPYALALDDPMNNDYGHTLVTIIFAVTVFFVRRVGYEKDGE
jgi:hypothetical protein